MYMDGCIIYASLIYIQSIRWSTKKRKKYVHSHPVITNHLVETKNLS